jgi:ankyrin repeat protein
MRYSHAYSRLSHNSCQSITTFNFQPIRLLIPPTFLFPKQLGRSANNEQLSENWTERRQEALQITDNVGWAPFHVASRRPSMPVVQLLLNTYPEAARIKTSEGWTPLHLLFRYRGADLTVEVVRLFLEVYPEPLALTSRTNAGRTPLHLACQYAASMPIIQLLMEDRAGRDASEGWTPLHITCRYRGADLTVEVAQLILKAFPEALTSRTHAGNTPLHQACHDPHSAR